MVNTALDIVVPFYNEASVLDQLCEDFIAQVDTHGHALPRGSFRVIAVNNASTDSSVDILHQYASILGMPELIVIDEAEKSVVQARKTGSEFALKEAKRYPFLLHIDADNKLPPTLVWDALQRFTQDSHDILAYSGHFSTEFWLKVPNLAERYYRDVGILEFSEETRRVFGFKEEQALFSAQVYCDFVRVPNQLGLGVRKSLFKAAGGYTREYQSNGEEILGEARNLWFRLDQLGGRLEHVRDPVITLNARRLLCDPLRWCGGRSYEGGMIDLRQASTEQDDKYALLNNLANTVDFAQIRRNLVKRLIIEPCVARPERMQEQTRYFRGCYPAMANDIENWLSEHELTCYSDALPLVLQLCERYSDTIINNLYQLRGLEH